MELSLKQDADRIAQETGIDPAELLIEAERLALEESNG
jgi:hypothetical protein